MSDNPNPRGWCNAAGDLFVDLEQVGSVRGALVYLVGRDEPISLIPMGEGDLDSLISALLVYRSGR